MKTIIAIIAATFAVPAFASEQPAPRASAAVAAPAQSGGTAQKADKERRYCVKDSITGSRMERKQCRTRAEWMKEGFDPLNPDK